MRFYIYQNSSWVEKKAQLQAISEDVKDETLDTACVQLSFDESEEVYPPRVLCKIVNKDTSATSGERSSYYHIATDNVEIQTLNPRTYKHTLTLVQTTRKLSHYVLPNMVITKPRESVVSTYFTNENILNLPYYFNNKVTEGIYTWSGFTCNYINMSNSAFVVDYPSPYWGECVALSKNRKFNKGRIKLYWDAIICTNGGIDATTHKIVNAQAKYTKLVRKIATPSWKDIYIVIYYTTTNINAIVNDTDIEGRVDLVSVPLNSIKWKGDYGFYDLTDEDVEKINNYDDGYVMCELVCKDTSDKPDVFWYKPSSTSTKQNLLSAYDRLFCDESEFRSAGVEAVSSSIQAIWSRLFLELSNKQDTLYEVLQRILDRQQCSYTFSKNKPLFTLPTSGDDYDILTTTESPEFTFNNLTVFEAVSQVLETIDALPRFDVSDDGTLTLGLDYFNQTGTSVPNDTKFASYASNASEQKRDNGILTNFQNAEIVSYFPCKPYDGAPIYTRARTKSYGLPEYSDFALAVDKPIKYVNHLWIMTSVTFNVVYSTKQTVPDTGRDYYDTEGVYLPIPLDLASFVFDESTYSSALNQGDYTSDYNRNVRLQMNCLKFRQGSKEISIGEKGTSAYNIAYNTLWKCMDVAFYRTVGIYAQNFRGYAGYLWSNKNLFTHSFPDESDFSSIWFACEYGTDLSGRLEIQSPYPKEEGQFTSSTSSSSPDLGKLGLNMLGLTLKSGEPTMTCTQMLTTWNNRIKVGDIFTKNNEKWIATKVSYTHLSSDSADEIIKGTIEFTKNFNGLSRRIGIDQSKRLYNIDRNIASLCEANITTYAYFEPMPYGYTPEQSPQDAPFSAERLGDVIMKAFTADASEYYEVSYALVTTTNNGANVATGIYVPLAVYGAGNCLCFETKFDDPISAGIKMSATSEGDTYWWATNKLAALYGNKYYYGSDVKYADEEGYAEQITISYRYATSSDYQFYGNFPEVGSSDLVGSSIASVSDLEFDKQPNEIFGLNYEIAFLSRYTKDNNQVFFGQRFFDTWNEKKGLKTTQVLFYYSTTETYGYSDTKGKGSRVPANVNLNPDLEYDEGQLVITGTLRAVRNKTYNLTSFALCDQDGNILISCNCEGAGCQYITYTKSNPDFPTLCFFVRQERL